MNRSSNPKRQPDLPELVALVNEVVAYWKVIARRNSDPSEFVQRWPKILTNFLLGETIRAAKARSLLSEDRDN